MITLHNQAILFADINPVESINKLVHIVSRPSFPKEALSNLITTYFRVERYEDAADFMAENIEVCFTQLSEARNQILRPSIQSLIPVTLGGLLFL